MNNHTIHCLARYAGQYLLGLFMLSGLSTANSAAQTLPKDLSQKAATYLSTWAKRRAHVGNVSVDSIRTNGRKVVFYADVTLSYIPMREPDVKDAPFEMKGYYENGKPMFELIDNHTENGLIRTYYYANGNKLMQSVGKEDAVKTEFWKEDGSSATAEEVQTQLREGLQRVNYLMSKHLR